MPDRTASLELIDIALYNGFGVKSYDELENYVVITKNNHFYVGFSTDYIPTDAYKRIRCMLEKEDINSAGQKK